MKIDEIKISDVIEILICNYCNDNYIFCKFCENNRMTIYLNEKKYCSLKCQRLFIDDEEKRKLTLDYLFESKVIKRDGCWGWKGKNGNIRYGVLKNNGWKMMAHRASWEIHKGKIPDGMIICHKCDNPPCTNPDHLFIGTHKDNMIDMIKKGRGRYGMNYKNLNQ